MGRQDEGNIVKPEMGKQRASADPTGMPDVTPRRRRGKWSRAWVPLLVLVLAWAGAQILPPRGRVHGPNAFRTATPGVPLVIAHAGGLGLNPENTLEAFAASVALGCDLLEMDVRLTRDGILVTHHDALVNRTSDGTGAVAEHTLAELKALNFGCHFRGQAGNYPYRATPAHIATVEELFQQYGRVPMVIELKDRGDSGARAAANLASLIARHQMTDRVLVASFDDATLDAFRRCASPGQATSTAKGETRELVLLSLARLDRLWRGRGQALQVPADPRESSGFTLASARFVRMAHGRNMAVHYWTVNDPEEMRRLIALGGDGLITDFPDRLQEVVRGIRERKD